ncbi:hypothetical protein [Fodinicola acaciae]|uniref:hypothetical protein n=1 Tax=Fodinicola acaciae TaxID=2681555 RepID=UPI0013CF4ECC|nr:hypothetical protein [Fodinicola acaciae]
MSSVSRGRRKTAGVYAEMVRTYEQLADEHNVLLVELATSGLLGMWWDNPLPTADADELIGGHLVTYARQRPSRSALAALRSLEMLAVNENLRGSAADAADELSGSGMLEPAWLDSVGDITAERGWKYRDAGGAEVLLVEFCQQDKPQALVVFLSGEQAVELSVTGHAGILLRELRKKAMAGGGHELLPLEPPVAGAAIEAALRHTDSLADPEVDKQYASLRALAYARCRLLV